ncbi:gamma-glutamyltranspeptidase [Mycena floridula]|nr:gamma-glutamyltranspeptidase [Mycena floridula]
MKSAKAFSELPVHSHRSVVRSHRPRGLKVLASCLIAFFLLHWIPRVLERQSTRTRLNPAVLIEAKHGAVATENKRCSDIGVAALKAGGNAVDAAIAANLCIGVVNMFSSGLGGGGFMTVRVAPSEVYTIDFRETAPLLSNKTMYTGRSNSSRYGGLSVGVPGELRGLQEAHRRWGSLPWKDLVQPSADLASGWEVDVELGKRITWYPDLMLNNPDWSSIFAPHGIFLKEGEIIRRSNYSRTLARIASHGPEAFYKGEIADSLLRKINITGGIMVQADLDNYQIRVDRAMEGSFHGKKIYTSHAPTSGPVLIHMLNLVERSNMTERTGLNTHRLVEILKFGFAARTRICDPDFQEDTQKMDEISTQHFADAIWPNITDDRTHPPEYYNPEFDIEEDHGTSHVSVLDKNGMAVALTSTVNLIFGSQVMDPETGVILNDEMDDFSVPGTPNGFGLWPSPYNYPEPHKRPLSSTVPTIMENSDGSFYMSLGASGGSRIFGAVFQVILNMGWGLNPSEAVEYGRLHDQLYPLVTEADSIYPAELLDALRRRGHAVSILDERMPAAVVQVVSQSNGTVFAASDSRKNGIASGY